MTLVRAKNCFPCYTKDNRLVPAKWVYDDDAICEGCRIQEGIGLAEVISLEQYRKDHGLQDAPSPSDAPMLQRDAGKVRKMKAGDGRRGCSNPKCGKPLRKDCKSDLCSGCRMGSNGRPDPIVKELLAKEAAAHVSLVAALDSGITEETMAERKCAEAGCETRITAANQSGRCTKHWYVKKGARGGVAGSKKRPEDIEPGTRSCISAGCAMILRSDNESGLCKKHRNPGRDRAVPAKLNKKKNPPKPNWDRPLAEPAEPERGGSINLSEEQMDKILLAMPMARKVEAVSAALHEYLAR